MRPAMALLGLISMFTVNCCPGVTASAGPVAVTTAVPAAWAAWGKHSTRTRVEKTIVAFSLYFNVPLPLFSRIHPVPIDPGIPAGESTSSRTPALQLLMACEPGTFGLPVFRHDCIWCTVR